MYRLFAILLGLVAVTASTNHTAPPNGKPAESDGSRSESDSVRVSAVRGVDYDYVHFYPGIEAIIRAHVRPDGPSADDSTITFDHMRDLACLSLRGQVIPNFFLFAVGPLRSLQFYDCQIKDFASIKYMAGMEELFFRGCNIKDISAFGADAAFASYGHTPPIRVTWSVRHLSLASNSIEDVTSLAGCQDLTWLDLRDNNIRSVAALKTLHKLTHLDIRDNPLGPDAEADIPAIKANNPGVHVLSGHEPGVSKENLRQQVSARALIAEFARCVRWRYEDGVAGAMLVGTDNGDRLPEDVSEALRCLASSQDKEYLSDLAAIFVKYMIEMENHDLPGPVWDPNAPLVKAFRIRAGMDGTRWEGMPALLLGRWILNHRDRLAPSVYLDVQIERYREEHQILVQKGRLKG
jgi:hypothetical protein